MNLHVVYHGTGYITEYHQTNAVMNKESTNPRIYNVERTDYRIQRNIKEVEDLYMLPGGKAPIGTMTLRMYAESTVHQQPYTLASFPAFQCYTLRAWYQKSRDRSLDIGIW